MTKIIDLLIKELPLQGGWPNGAVAADWYGYGEIKFLDENDMFMSDVPHIVPDENLEVQKNMVTREEYLKACTYES